jgi:hypothetical protein
MGDPDRPLRRVGAQELRKDLHPARHLSDLDTCPILNGYTRGIVSPVLQPAEAIKQDRHGLAPTDVPDDTAHPYSS